MSAVAFVSSQFHFGFFYLSFALYFFFNISFLFTRVIVPFFCSLFHFLIYESFRIFDTYFLVQFCVTKRVDTVFRSLSSSAHVCAPLSIIGGDGAVPKKERQSCRHLQSLGGEQEFDRGAWLRLSRQTESSSGESVGKNKGGKDSTLVIPL